MSRQRKVICSAAHCALSRHSPEPRLAAEWPRHAPLANESSQAPPDRLIQGLSHQPTRSSQAPTAQGTAAEQACGRSSTHQRPRGAACASNDRSTHSAACSPSRSPSRPGNRCRLLACCCACRAHVQLRASCHLASCVPRAAAPCKPWAKCRHTPLYTALFCGLVTYSQLHLFQRSSNLPGF